MILTYCQQGCKNLLEKQGVNVDKKANIHLKNSIVVHYLELVFALQKTEKLYVGNFKKGPFAGHFKGGPYLPPHPPTHPIPFHSCMPVGRQTDSQAQPTSLFHLMLKQNEIPPAIIQWYKKLWNVWPC